MTGNYSALSNFKIRSINDNISTIFATNYAGITIGAPTNFHGGWNNVMPADVYVGDGISGGSVPNTRKVVCEIPFTGKDTETGFDPPTGSPMYANVLYEAGYLGCPTITSSKLI